VERISLDVFKQLMINEVTLLQKLSHPNIIQLVEYNCHGEIVVKNSGKTI
jgi:serine/threonine protein kinase